MFQVWLREPRANRLRGALGGLAAQARLPLPTPLRAAVGDRPRPARRGGGMPRGSRRDHNVVDGAAAAMGGAALSKDMCSFPHLGLARRRRGRCRRGRVCGHPVAPTPSGLRCVTSPASFCQDVRRWPRRWRRGPCIVPASWSAVPALSSGISGQLAPEECRIIA